MRNEFERSDSLFSLCGLNCGLCPMYIRGDCGGCFTDSPCYLTCPIAPCSVEHGNVEYCYQCNEYPCSRYDGIDLHDSLISHRNQKKDLAKAKRIGIDGYLKEQREKVKILNRILTEYDDGRNDVFFCLAVNMLDLSDLTAALENADKTSANMPKSEKAELMKQKLYHYAEKRNIPLELRR